MFQLSQRLVSSVTTRNCEETNTFKMNTGKRLTGKVAIVTASSYGIGFAIIRRLAEDGASVVVSSRGQSNVDAAVQQLKSEGHRVCGVVCHVGKKEDREKLIEQTLREFGKINIVVCNAAVNPYIGPILKTTESQWDKVIDVNVKSTFLLCKEVVPHMDSTQGGAIILLGSSVGFRPHPLIGVYSISKTALIGLVKSLAPELTSHKIRINLVAPGLIRTNFSEKILNVDELRKLAESNAMGRHGQRDECAGAVAFLASDEASFITGETLVIDGGLNFRL